MSVVDSVETMTQLEYVDEQLGRTFLQFESTPFDLLTTTQQEQQTRIAAVINHLRVAMQHIEIADIDDTTQSAFTFLPIALPGNLLSYDANLSRCTETKTIDPKDSSTPETDQAKDQDDAEITPEVTDTYERPGLSRDKPTMVRLSEITPILTREEFDSSCDSELNDKDRPYVLLIKLCGKHPDVKRAERQLRRGGVVLKSATDLVGRYNAEAAQYPSLDPSERKQLFTRLDHGIEFLNKLDRYDSLTLEEEGLLIESAITLRALCLCNLRLVVSIASKFAKSSSIPLIDLIQEGNIGLSMAIARFDVKKGFALSTYATWWIRQSITRAIEIKSRIVKVPAHIHAKYLNFRKTTDELEKLFNRPATLNEIADAMGETAEGLEELMRVSPYHLKSLNEPMREDGDTEMGDFIPSGGHDADDLEDKTIHRENIERIFADNNWKNVRQKVIISLRFGVYIQALDNFVFHPREGQSITYRSLFTDDIELEGSGYTLDKIGGLFGSFGRENVRIIERGGFDYLRSAFVLQHEEGTSVILDRTSD